MPRNDGMENEVQAEYPDHGALRDAAAELSNLPWVRFTERTRAPRDRRKLWLLLVLVLLAHALLGWFVWQFVHPVRYRHEEKNVIAVMLIEPPANLPAPPPLLAPPPPGQPARPTLPHPVHHEAPAKGAIQAQMEGVKTPPLTLYQSNGQIRIPPSASTAAPVPAYRAAEIKGSQIYSGKSPVPYKPTRFNQDWAPDKESLGQKTVGRAIDKVIEKTTVKKTVHLPGGIKLHCALSPLALFAGCKGDDPQPPPKNDNDIRLSMPPAETLTGKKVEVPASASSVPPPASSG
ncbi:MAG TPA: hypothetical protein VHD89_02565 [Rhodanobacteraceae bacterium]|nr:hypothetical protein [Rhodanobacteraceae bacterium]